MKSSEVLQLPESLYSHQQTCTICHKHSTQNPIVLCSSGCTDLITHATWAFVQGFLISCILCLCEKDTEVMSQSEAENVSSGHDCHVHTSVTDRPDQGTVKQSSETPSFSSSAVFESSSPFFETDCREIQMDEEGDLDAVNISPSQFSLDSHIDFDLVTQDLLQEVKHTEEMIAVPPSLPDHITATSPQSERRAVSHGSATEMLLTQKNNTSCYSRLAFCEQILNPPSESDGGQQSVSNKVSVSNVKSKSDHQMELEGNGLNCFKGSNDKFQCTHCCKIFHSKCLLNQHVKTHNAENQVLQKESQQNFTCEYCAQMFMNRYSLKAHIRRKHSGEEPVECDICGKAQPGSFALSAHKKACHDFSSLCHICGAEFSGRTSFDKHMACHQGVKRFFCDVCGAGFVHSSSLNTHSSVHLTTKSFQCHVCSQLFKAQHLLNGHLLKAHQCGPSLEHRIRGLKKMGVEVDRDAVHRHANKRCLACGGVLVGGGGGVCPSHPDHSQEVFHCPTCGDRTSNIVLFYQHVKWHKGSITSHARRTTTSFTAQAPAPPPPPPLGRRLSHHRPEPGTCAGASLIRCEVCSKTFKNFEYLSAHMHQHREARFSCEVCGKHFTYKCNLKTHMNTHLDTWQFECDTCGKKFRDKYTFKKHQLKHSEPQFKCQVCGKALTRRPYLIKHYQKLHPQYKGSY